jgi:hypothetical protein
MMKALHLAAGGAAITLGCSQAAAWGNEGHETIALIARHYIDQSPALAAKMDSILAGARDPDVGPGFAVLGTWADQYRSSSPSRTKATHQWHFVDIELDGSNDKVAACFGNKLPSGSPAFPGIPDDCVVNKINQFERELRDPSTSAPEREIALLFLLHFIGDVHQPLHAADNHDRGGNAVFVVTGKAKAGTNLHSYWDTTTVRRLGSTPEKVANALIAGIDNSDVASWTPNAATNPTWAWADESFAIARQAYSKLPKKKRSCTERPDRNKAPIQTTCIVISKAYATWATGEARTRLQQAGVRLAAVIREALQ